MSSTDRLFRCITTFNFSLTRKTIRARSALLYVRINTLPLRHETIYVITGIITHYVLASVCLYFCYRIPEGSVH